jgi:hypothetical protein
LADERDLRAHLKRKVIALAVIERSRKKECARIANIKGGATNTKVFHMRVNARRKKNHIYRLKHNQGWVKKHGEKDGVIQQDFQADIVHGNPREQDFNWDEIHSTNSYLQELQNPFPRRR